MSGVRWWPLARLVFTPPLDPAERDRLLVDLDDVAALGLVDETDGVRVYFEHDDDRRAAIDLLTRAGWTARGTITALEEPDEGWAARSQADLPAVRVGDVIVSPPWDVARVRAELDAHPEEPQPVVIEIEPSTGFGTGHHQSTRLCLRALQQLDVSGLDVLDIGTGSGVLAIAAVMRGARSALGIDPDQDAIDAALDSVARNHVATVTLKTTGLEDETLAAAPLVFANLTGVMLRREAARIQARIEPQGRAILSGFTEDDETWVTPAFDQCDVEARLDEESWLALVVRRRG